MTNRLDVTVPAAAPEPRRRRPWWRGTARLWRRGWRLLTWPLRWPVRFGIGLAVGSATMAVLLVLGTSAGKRAVEAWETLIAREPPVAAFRIVPEAEEPVRIRVLWQDRRARERSAVLDYRTAVQIRADVVRALQEERLAVLAVLEEIVERESMALEQDALGRIDAYAGWYFAPRTFYELLWVQSRAATANLIPPLGRTRLEMMERALAARMNDRYVELVVHPENLEPGARAAFARAYREAAQAFRRALGRIEARLESRLLLADQPEADVVATFNWDRQRAAFGRLAAEPAGSDALIRCTVVGITGLAGMRMAIAPVGAGAATLAGRASARLWGRLAGPVSARTATAAGLTGLGAAVAGPLGVGAAIAGGLVVDWGFAKASELRHRDGFEEAVAQTVRGTFAEARAQMRLALAGVVGQWFERSLIDVEQALSLPGIVAAPLEAQLQPSTR